MYRSWFSARILFLFCLLEIFAHHRLGVLLSVSLSRIIARSDACLVKVIVGFGKCARYSHTCFIRIIFVIPFLVLVG